MLRNPLIYLIIPLLTLTLDNDLGFTRRPRNILGLFTLLNRPESRYWKEYANTPKRSNGVNWDRRNCTFYDDFQNLVFQLIVFKL